MRIRPWALGAFALVAAGCAADSQLGDVELEGPNSLAVAGRTLLVAMTGEAHLRAIDLEDSQFVRAPNPLFALSVPTAPFPSAVSAWTSDDAASSAPFAFGLSSASSQLSVVSTRDLALIGNLPVPQTALAVATMAESPGVSTRVVVAAESAGGTAALWSASFFPSLADDPSGLAAIAFEELVSLGDSVPKVLAASPVDRDLLVVGDRKAAAGGLAVVGLAAGSVERYDVGGPVRALSFAPDGTRVFGLLDSDGCAAAGDRCGGLFAFDLASRALVPSAGGGPVEIPGTARGLAVGGASTLTLSGDAKKSVESLVVVSSTNGSLFLFDGGALGAIDANTALPSGEVSHVEPDGTVSELEGGPTDLAFAEGAARTETVRVSFEGTLVNGEAGTVSGSGIDLSRDLAALGVQPGDRVAFADSAACPAAEVGAVSADRLEISGLGAGCVGAVSFSVSAAGDYVVTGSESGPMGRVAAGERFTWSAPYFYAPEGHDPSAPAVAFTMGSGDPRPGAAYVIAVDSGFGHFSVPLEGLSMPGAVARDPKTNFFYAAYHGGNAVVRLDPGALVPGSDDKGLAVFR